METFDDFDEYQELALRTASPTSTESERAMITSAALGLSGESGEIADHVKKIVYHGHPLDDETRDKIAKEIGDIGKQFKDFKDDSTLDRDCAKKIERLEKLTKKVRSEAGGDDEEITITPRPTDLTSAMKQISEASENLSKEVQNTPRRVVSASVISRANVLLELIRLARGFVHPQP